MNNKYIVGARVVKKLIKELPRISLIMVMVAFFLFPIFWMISTAFKPRVEMFRLPPKWIFTPTIENFQYVFDKMHVKRWTINSIIISMGATILSLLLGVPAGYGLSRLHFRGKKALVGLLLLTRAIPPIVIVLPFRAITQWMRLFGTWAAVILIDTVYDASFTAWLMEGIFDSIPRDLEDSALVDGCSPFQAFVKIVLPLSKPGLVTSALFTFILSWNDFLFALSLTTPETSTLPLGMLSTFGILQQGWTYMMALACIAIGPVVIISLLLQRYYISGLTFGGVK